MNSIHAPALRSGNGKKIRERRVWWEDVTIVRRICNRIYVLVQQPTLGSDSKSLDRVYSASSIGFASFNSERGRHTVVPSLNSTSRSQPLVIIIYFIAPDASCTQPFFFRIASSITRWYIIPLSNSYIFPYSSTCECRFSRSKLAE